MTARFLFLTTLIWDVMVCQVFRRQNWWDAVEPDLILGAFPTQNSVKHLQNMGVSAVINMCKELSGPVEEYERCGIEQLRLPTVDFSEPTIDDIRLAIDYIDRHRGVTGSVYIHCKSGRGRSATVVLCWLMQHYQISSLDSQKILQKKRGQVLNNLHKRKCVQLFSAPDSNSPSPDTCPPQRNSKA